MSARMVASGVAVAGRLGAARLERFDLDVTGGIHALVGSAGDGVGAALAVLAGEVRPFRGAVWRPEGTTIAWVPRANVRFDPLRVDHAMKLAFDVRGVPGDPASALATLGAARLVSARMTSLADDEARTVALAIALAFRTTFVLLEEPFAAIDVATSARLAELLEERVRAGTVVIVATASRREAVRLGAREHRLVRGVSMGRDPSACFLVTCSDARALAAALTAEPEIRCVYEGDDRLQVFAADAPAASLAIGRAVERAGVDISTMEVAP